MCEVLHADLQGSGGCYLHLCPLLPLLPSSLQVVYWEATADVCIEMRVSKPQEEGKSKVSIMSQGIQ